MAYEIEVREADPQPMVSIRTTCKVAAIGLVLSEILPEVFYFLEKKGVRPAGPPFTRYHSFNGSDCEIEAGFPVPAPQPGEGSVTAGELPGGPLACTVHVGAYEDLPRAHDAIDSWMKENGKKSRGPQWESYLTDPGKEPDPGKRMTELLWPVE